MKLRRRGVVNVLRRRLHNGMRVIHARSRAIDPFERANHVYVAL